MAKSDGKGGCTVTDPKFIIGICREDDPNDVDEAYGDGTYDRLFPDENDYCEFCGRKITWADDADIDEDTERICGNCERQRDDARRDEALGI